ncbi:hypothetical protein FRC03_003574 [Tulasnella sp. 419]|nr:hypothetical protein FRC03_003574 [Tulasnella sp. 419]
MDVVSLSFVYPRGQDTDAGSHDAVAAVALQAMSLHPSCMVAASPSEDGRGYAFLVTGPQTHALAAKGLILRDCPVQTRLSIKVPRSEILDFVPTLPAPSLKPQVRRRLDEIASQTLAHIAVVNPSSPLPPPMDVLGRNTASSPFPSLFAPLHSNGLETEPLCQLVITGTGDSVDVAKVRLLVMLDELSGLHSEAVDIDHKLHPIIAARKRTVIQAIQEETATNIYFPTPLRDLVGGPSAPPLMQNGTSARMNRNVIWITGEFFGVQRARDMLFQAAHTKSKQVISRDAAILPRKLDWMLTERLEELKTIMSDNATFLDFPVLGSQSSVVGVYGDNRVNIQRTIRAIMLLATQFYTAQFYLLPTHFNLLLPPSSINANQITPILTRLSTIAGGAEVVFKDNCFEVFGLENEARRGIMSIGELPIVKTFHHEIRFQLELANEHRDFISGKKNGKINKIMQVTNCKIRFDTLTAPATAPPSPTNNVSQAQEQNGVGMNNGAAVAQNANNAVGMPTPANIPPPALPSSSTAPTNFVISISGTLHEALQGLSMLLEELPAEISFHVPESYHKRIIGVGGRNIQRIMKRWGVFVKFFNGGDEWAPGPGGSPTAGTSPSDGNTNASSAGGGGSPPGTTNPALPGTNGTTPNSVLDAEDNVVARTPAKNAMNLENLKAAVLELVYPKDKDFTHETVAIPRRYHRTLLGEKNIFIKDIESKTGSRVRFPDKETASDVVTIYGPESQVHIAAARLLDHVPFEAEMTVPSQPDLARLCASPEFAAFTDRIKREYQVSIIANISSLRANNKKSISTLSSVSSSGEDANGSVANGNGSLSSSGSNVPSFKFLCQRSNMDFLAPAREALESFLNNHGAILSYGYGSVPTVGSVGVSPVGGSGHVTVGSGSSVGMGVSLAVGSNGLKHKRADSFADAFPHFNSKILATPSSDAGFVHRRLRLANSTPDVKALFHSSSVAASASSSQVYKLPEHDEQDDAGFEAPVQQGNEYYPPRIRHAPSISYIAPIRNSEDALKRGSDSLLESKLKQQQQQHLGKPRSLNNRAQSLDLTAMNRSGPVNTMRAASPEDYATPPSPTSATASSFPSVNPSMNGYGTVQPRQSQPHHYTHQNHYSFPNATYTHPSYHHQHHLSYSRPRTHVSLSTSSSSLSLASAAGTIEQQPSAGATLNLDGDSSDQSVMDEVSRVISQIRLDSLH